MLTRNRRHNLSNPYQGNFLKVLCVCSAGLLRSPTMANVLHREFNANTRAVGTSSDYALIPLEEAHLLWADEVVCADAHTKSELLNFCGANNIPVEYLQITNLHIPDKYAFMDKELQALIIDNYKKSLECR